MGTIASLGWTRAALWAGNTVPSDEGTPVDRYICRQARLVFWIPWMASIGGNGAVSVLTCYSKVGFPIAFRLVLELGQTKDVQIP